MVLKETHFVDTSVIFGAGVEARTKKEKQERKQCERYASRLSKIYKGVVSIPILGEYIENVLSKDYRTALKLFDFLYGFIEYNEIEIISVDDETITIFRKIKEIDPRIEFIDALHLACAKQKGIKVFTTIDTCLLKSKKLQKELNIKIRHPRGLI